MASASKIGLQTSLIVKSYDEAIAFFVEKLGFEMVEDSPAVTSEGSRPKRWVVIRPPGTSEGNLILLAQADGAEQQASVGNQFAGRVGMFWHVTDFEPTYTRMCSAGVQFTTTPRDEQYGRVAVFLDVSGNKWDLIGPGAPVRPSVPTDPAV